VQVHNYIAAGFGGGEQSGSIAWLGRGIHGTPRLQRWFGDFPERLNFRIMRYLFLAGGILLMLYAGAKTYVVFQRPAFGPELLADATFAVLLAVVCFTVFAKVGKKKRG
jgi:hypothetical protein